MIKQKESDDNFVSLLIKAVKLIRDTQIASTASLQMRLQLNYGTALKIMDTLEDMDLGVKQTAQIPAKLIFNLKSLDSLYGAQSLNCQPFDYA